jgi:hypothetical protein
VEAIVKVGFMKFLDTTLSLRLKYGAALLMLVLCACPFALATVVVVIITPTGIVIGADGRSVISSARKGIPIGSRRTKKMFLMQGRLVLVGIGFTSASSGSHTVYEFSTWAAGIEKRLPANVSITEFIEIVENEGARTFEGFDAVIKSGTLKKKKSFEKYLVQYLIVGYDDGVPTLYKVDFEIDWNHQHLIGPILSLVHPEKNARVDFGIYALGSHVAIGQIGDPKSKAHNDVAAGARGELDSLLSHRDLNLEQAARLIRRLIAVEAENNPAEVGPPISIITIPKPQLGKLVPNQGHRVVLSRKETTPKTSPASIGRNR